MAKYQTGQSGNPNGRPKGSLNKATKLRKDIEKHIPEVLNKLIEQAKDGDTQSIKLLLERVIPPLKSIDMTVSIPLGNDLSESAETVLKAVGAGQITTGQAAQLIQVVSGQARITEIDELVKRIEALEEVKKS